MVIERVKLVIWDLDDTLWQGTLSDGDVNLTKGNIQLIKDLISTGIMCSICSKNDRDTVISVLEQNEIWDLFVFSSINWSPKGERVKQIVNEMGLRYENTLFIDDNPSNRGEVKLACPGMMVEDVNAINILKDFVSKANKNDICHKRLKQYKILETKRSFKATTASNEEFLYKSNIRLDIRDDCIQQLDRISELILRSNQLNFTKVRSSKEQLQHLIIDETCECRYITVSDVFGDYGIIGFYALQGNRLIHFVFSCRTLNMGIEQYVYKKLGFPLISIVGEVASDLYFPDPVWINQEEYRGNINGAATITNNLLFKGPCDISQIFSYLKSNNTLLEEFTYVNKNGIVIEGRNHTEHIVQSLTLTDEDLCCLKQLPFYDNDMFKTKMFDDTVNVIVYSLFTDANLGLYREKESKIKVAFGEWTNDLTDTKRWKEYLDNKDNHLYLANWKPQLRELEMIKEKYTFEGRLSPEQVMSNIEKIYSIIGNEKKLCLCLGSETPYLANVQPAYNDRHIYHRELNKLVRDWAQEKRNIYLLDFNKYVLDQNDFAGNINHFKRIVYYRMTQDLLSYLESLGTKLQKKSYIKTELFSRPKDVLKRMYKKLKG